MNPLSGLYSIHLVILIAFGVFFYRAAQMDRSPGILWAGLSILVYLLTRVFFHGDIQAVSWGRLSCFSE
jgi:hypothetical protein